MYPHHLRTAILDTMPRSVDTRWLYIGDWR